MPELVAPFALAFTWRRSTGPVIGRFLGSLADGRFEGIVAADGDVLVPPREYDPRTGEETTGQWREVGPDGVIESHGWDEEGGFAWALIRLDGADQALLHRVAGPMALVRTGARVRAIWAEERVGSILDVRGFEVLS